MTSTQVARALSVLGHPALLVPGAVVWTSVARHASPSVLYAAAAASVFVAISVGVYSVVQVRAGRWEHVDASVPRERRQLNLFLALLLFGTSGALWWRGLPRAVYLGLALCGVLVVFTHMLRRWLKTSLHVGFAVFAALLVWPDALVCALLMVLAVGVAWSRLVLRRHTLAEVVVGFLAGGFAGLGFQLFTG